MVKDLNSIDEVELEIYNQFQDLADWSEKYEYLIDLGRELGKLELDDKIEKNKLANCTSRVWISYKFDTKSGLISFEGESDSLIIAGLLSLVFKIYKGQKPQDIINTDLNWFYKIGFKENLTNTRSNGLQLILDRIIAICGDVVKIEIETPQSK